MQQTMEYYCHSVLEKLFSQSLAQLYELKHDCDAGIYAACDYDMLKTELCEEYGEAGGNLIYQALDTYEIDCDAFALNFDESTREFSCHHNTRYVA